jgi:hypothetical protein
MAARPRFERGPPGSGPGVVPLPPPRNGLDGRTRTSSPRLPTPVRSHCATSRRVLTGGVEPPLARLSTLCLFGPASEPQRSEGETSRRLGYVSIGTDGRIRTDTGGGLSAVPLPVLGYVSVVDRAGVEPATFSVQGSCASCCASGPWWRVRGSNPPGEGYGPSLISRSPAVGGVTGRTRTGFLRGHDPACRPLQLRPQSTRRESNPGVLRVREAVCR